MKWNSRGERRREEKVQGKSREQGCGTREWSNRVIKRDSGRRKGRAGLVYGASCPCARSPPPSGGPGRPCSPFSESASFPSSLPSSLPAASLFWMCSCSLFFFLFFFMLPTGPVSPAYCRMLAREPGLSSSSSVAGSLASPRRVSSYLVSSRSTCPFLRFL